MFDVAEGSRSTFVACFVQQLLRNLMSIA